MIFIVTVTPVSKNQFESMTECIQIELSSHRCEIPRRATGALQSRFGHKTFWTLFYKMINFVIILNDILSVLRVAPINSYI